MVAVAVSDGWGGRLAHAVVVERARLGVPAPRARLGATGGMNNENDIRSTMTDQDNVIASTTRVIRMLRVEVIASLKLNHLPPHLFAVILPSGHRHLHPTAEDRMRLE